ncbi:uncharacterized protein LOC135701802 [Ochlerotatus camptorhynchus]|uniref:uncharacterized protein LOC135701802 n=1 Tax=Ochlerotatus camptorhynchus TaxID=644619 RepID=UPI0031E00328
MDTNINRAPSPIKRLLNRMKLLPLIESCETVWPSKLDMQLILPTYEADLRNLRSALENDSFQLLQETDNEDVLKFQVSFMSCCYESTAFLLSEELATEQQSLREGFIWSKLMHFSTRKAMVSHLFKQYRKTLLDEDWFYHFGSLSSFWGFVWDLLDFDRDLNLIDRNVVELIEQVSFRLMQSKSVQLFVKGVTVLEECIHKTRGHSLVDYETIYRELSKHTWRLSSEDERNQHASIIMLAAMLECVRVLEVERNQLMTLIQNFAQPSRADSLMDIVLKGLKESCAVSKSIELMENLLQMLAIDHDCIRVISEELLDDSNNNRSTDTDGNANFSLAVMKGTGKIDLRSADWWKDIIVPNRGRFHRWTRKLLRLLISEIEKFENFHAIHYQYLCCAMFFLVDSKSSDTADPVGGIFQLLVAFVKKMVNRVEPVIAAAGETSYSNLQTCKLLVEANVACVRDYATFVPEARPSGMKGNGVEGSIASRQLQHLNKLQQKISRW